MLTRAPGALPRPHRDQRAPQVQAAFGQPVLGARAAGRHLQQQLVSDHALQPLAQHRARDIELAEEVAESPRAAEGRAQQAQHPGVTENVDGARRAAGSQCRHGYREGGVGRHQGFPASRYAVKSLPSGLHMRVFLRWLKQLYSRPAAGVASDNAQAQGRRSMAPGQHERSACRVKDPRAIRGRGVSTPRTPSSGDAASLCGLSGWAERVGFSAARPGSRWLGLAPVPSQTTKRRPPCNDGPFARTSPGWARHL